MEKRHLIFYKVLRPLVVLFLRLRFGYRFEKAKALPQNYIVLSNHATDYDMLFVAASFCKQMYFVGSEHIARWKIYPLLKYAFAPIIRYKGTTATSAVMEMLRRVRRGGNVCMFAEGVRTWVGQTCAISPGTAKVIKAAGCGLVTYKLTGGYFASPMWAGASVRRGPVHGAPVRVYTKEQLKEMTVEQIHDAITADLYEDAYARQLADPKPYRGKNLAKGLENLLFLCPVCGKHDSFRAQGDQVRCDGCGLEMRYDRYGMLSGGRFRTLLELSDWQKEQVLAAIAGDIAYEADAAALASVRDHRETPVDRGRLTVTPKALQCGDTVFSMEEISDMAMHGQRAIVFSVRDEYYELIPDTGSNALKIYLYYCGCKNRLRERVG